MNFDIEHSNRLPPNAMLIISLIHKFAAFDSSHITIVLVNSYIYINCNKKRSYYARMSRITIGLALVFTPYLYTKDQFC